MIHCPRTMSSPCEVPSRGRVSPDSLTTLISTPKALRPCLAKSACFCSEVQFLDCGGRMPMVPTAVVSVMPQPWRTSTP